MLRKLIFAGALVSVSELGLLVWIAHRVGVLPTLGVTLLGAVLGTSISMRQGRRVVRDWQAAFASGQPPAAGALEALLTVASGVLLAVPGLLTDALGLLLLLAPARRLVARQLRGWVGQHFEALPRRPDTRQVPHGVRRGRAQVVDTEGETVPDTDTRAADPPRLHGPARG